jgi:hypothetical protein
LKNAKTEPTRAPSRPVERAAEVAVAPLDTIELDFEYGFELAYDGFMDNEISRIAELLSAE